MKKLAVFASGTGSNFEAIARSVANGDLNDEITLLVCDKPQAAVIGKAKKFEINTLVIEPKNYDNKELYESVIVTACQNANVDLIVLAGYMRLVGNKLLEAYPKQIINIHPSLLPSFKGKDAISQAIEYGVKVTGVTVHYVDAGMDTGEIISQQPLVIEKEMDVKAAIHKIEHELLVQTIKQLTKEETE